jgi:hypothetical protein
VIRHQVVRILSAIADRLEPDKRACNHACPICSQYKMTAALNDIISGHIVGKGVAGRGFTPGSGTEFAY